MAMAGPWGIFYHIPKCGGLTVRKYLENKYRNEGIELVSPHAYPAQINGDYQNVDQFTFVREPADWLLSFYTYLRNNNWTWSDLPKAIDEKFMPYYGMFWPMFVNAICKEIPGVVGDIFDLYSKPGVITYRLEDIEEVFKMKLPNIHPTVEKPLMTDEHLQMIHDAERGAMWRYGYSN